MIKVTAVSHLNAFLPQQILSLTLLLLLTGGGSFVVTTEIFAAEKGTPAEGWTRFRGPNGTGVAQDSGFPSKWEESQYEWAVDIEGYSHGSPVVWEGQIFLTTALQDGTVRRLMSVDLASGKTLWSRDLDLQTVHLHKKNSYSSGSPATDGKRVYVAFGDEQHWILAAFGMDGKPLWTRDFGEFNSQHGPGGSPIVVDGLVILAKDMMGPSSIHAVSAETGEVVWSVDRKERRTSYATPMLHTRTDGRKQLICLSGASGLCGLDVQTGEQIWTAGEMPMRTVASPMMAGNLVIATCGSGGSGKLLLAVDPNGTGDVSDSHVKWETKRELPYVPTPVYDGKHLYLWADAGIVSCLDPATGKSLWKQRVKGKFSGSPVLIGDRIFAINEDGIVVVIGTGEEFELLGETPLNDLCYGTPAIAEGYLLLRTSSKLMALKGKSAQ